MAELDDLIAFTMQKYTERGGKCKKTLSRIAACKTIKDLLKVRNKLGMMKWENK